MAEIDDSNENCTTKIQTDSINEENSTSNDDVNKSEIEQLGDTSEPLFRSFAHVNIFDNLETMFDDVVLTKDRLTLKKEETNENVSCSLEPSSIENFTHSTLNMATESQMVNSDLMERIFKIKIKSGDALLDKALMSTNAETETVPNDRIDDDDDFFLSAVSDPDSSTIFSKSDMEEVDMEESKLCKDFKYIIFGMEDETKLAETKIGVGDMERSSLVRIMESLVSEDSSSNTETINFIKELLDNSKEDVNVNINQESIDYDNYGSIDWSLHSIIVLKDEVQDASIISELADSTIDSSEPAYRRSLIYGSSVPDFNVNEGNSKENEFDLGNSFEELEVDTDGEFAPKDNAVWFDESIQNKFLQTFKSEVVSAGFSKE